MKLNNISNLQNEKILGQASESSQSFFGLGDTEINMRSTLTKAGAELGVIN